MKEFAADIEHFNPGFSSDDAARAESASFLCGAETAGLVLARNAGDGSTQVEPDYVSRYQGFTLGEFVCSPGGPLAARGYRN